MRVKDRITLRGGTKVDLLEMAAWRARFEVCRGLAGGADPDEVRREIIGRFREEIAIESFGEYADETLMAALQREVEAALSVALS